MFTRRVLLAIVIAISQVLTTQAADSVIVNSKTVAVGEEGVDIDVRLVNDSSLAGLVVPFLFRSLDSGAFITDISPSFEERLDGGALTTYQYFTKYIAGGWPCNEGGGYVTARHVVEDSLQEVDTRPYCIMASALRTTDSNLAPGSDETGSIRFTVNVTDTAGEFEIDTTCTSPANHLTFATSGLVGFTPEFAKGTITIVECNCDRHGDVNNDTYMTVLDITALAAYLNNGTPIPPDDDSCPHVNRADVNCDGDVDEDDYNYLIAYVFQSGPAPCDPCDCDPYPSSCP